MLKNITGKRKIVNSRVNKDTQITKIEKINQ